MFSVRPYSEKDLAACGECFYEGFFTAPVDENDKSFLRDYTQIIIEKSNFTYVAETDERKVTGFICGKYSKNFSTSLAGRYETKKHYFLWCKMFLKFYLKRYKLSESFQKEFDGFFRQLQERDSSAFGKCDLELVALSSKKAYRKGLGTALLTEFLRRAEADGADLIRLFTNSLASWEFYEKRGFTKIAEYPFKDDSGNRSIVYEYRINREK
ncbi:MAG TPA: GNAT family N-acetyltransferase [Candidatus Copromorpha excrementigallinarum]|uniref:GNAT family N-acetyltransferase n=1 Tax=Candidatus Allocopromorpha excrementigallinarum TaxID=2840742 RepID=A0A9D1L5Z5_9FIRM|nr:GNAT family N-acetyltransferase [Candidatus Copromorpha excrementigallinarum]